ncbi:MAG: FkbM family methyltransferase, partial [Thermoplasmata archaeon]
SISPIRVTCRQLDSVSSEIAKAPSFVKIDVQGFEQDVLQGASKCFERWNPRPSMLLEFEPDGILSAGGSPDAFLNRLAAMDYRFARVSEGVLRPITREGRHKYSDWAGIGCNLFAVPEERIVELSLVRLG